MEIIRIVILSAASLLVLFILTKIIGDRQISELSMFDYINSITIGSITAEMATSSKGDYQKPLTAMIVYAVLSFAISYLTCKSIVLRRIFEGQSMVLFQNGQLYEKNLLKSKIDVNEFLAMCRDKDYFDLEDISTAILETNGKLSIIPVAKKRPTTVSDLNLNPAQNFPLANVIISGNVLKDNLKSTGKDEVWLKKQISNHGITNIKEVMLGTYDVEKDKLNIYAKMHKKMTRDIFQ